MKTDEKELEVVQGLELDAELEPESESEPELVCELEPRLEPLMLEKYSRRHVF